MALSLRHRLKRKNDIEAVLRSGRRHGGTTFRLFFYPNDRNYARFAFVVSKKAARHAVDRNRMRRRITGWLQQQRSILGVPFDVVCIVSSRAFQLNRKELYDDLQKYFHLPHHALSGRSLTRP